MSTESERYQPVVDDVVIRENATRLTGVPRATSEATVSGMAAPVRDLVHWGPTWVGVLTAFAIFLTLDLLITAVGWITATARGVAPTSGTMWWLAILGAIAFFIGAGLAQTTSAVHNVGNGLLTGFVIWALGAALIAVISTVGSGMFGSPLAGMADGTAATTTVNNVRWAALDGFIFLIVILVAALIGGFIGNQMPTAMNRTALGTRRMPTR